MKQRQKQNNYLLIVMRWGWKWRSTNNLYPGVLKEHRIANAPAQVFVVFVSLGVGTSGSQKSDAVSLKAVCVGEGFVRHAHVILVVLCKVLKTNFYGKNNRGHGAIR